MEKVLEIGDKLFEVNRASGRPVTTIRQFFIVGETSKFWKISHNIDGNPLSIKIKKDDLTEYTSSYRKMMLSEKVDESILKANEDYKVFVEYKMLINDFVKSNFHHMKPKMTDLDKKIFNLLKEHQ